VDVFNGANLYLIVNFVIAMSFAGVFFAVSRRSRSRAAARWIGLGFAVASLSVPAELVIAYTPFVRPGAAVAFAAVLAGLLLIRMGVGSLYNVNTRPAPLAIFLVVCTAIVIAIYDQPRSTLSHSIPYQTPFAISCLLSAAAIAFSSHRAPVDRWMMFVFSLTGAHFFLKAYLAAAVGAGRVASDYLFSNYAVISQSLTAVLMVMTGLSLLAVLVLQIMADERSNSEIDSLSRLLNRRGFEKHAGEALRRSPIGPHSVIFCDIDHFKRVNDTYGHYAGDAVIRTVGQLLAESVSDSAVVGRLGGEEFGILLPRVQLDAAMLLAHAIRGAIAVHKGSGMPDTLSITASFGVSTFSETGGFARAMRLADNALYDAKAAGRNCVKYRLEPLAIVPAVG